MKHKIKYWLGIVLFFGTITAHSQNIGTDFTDVLVVRTDFNYSINEPYQNGDVNDFWRILKSDGCALITPNVGVANEAWTLNDFNYWINATGQTTGTYYYRFNFCVQQPEVVLLDVVYDSIAGIVSADNTIKTIRLDGQIIVDFADSANCQNQTTRDNDFACYRFFAAQVPSNLLGAGPHILEFEVYNDQDDITGLLVYCAIKTISGKVMSTSNGTVSGSDTACTTGQIRGVVFNDGNLNGVKDVNESNITGVDVSLINSKGVLVQTLQTDADGAYSFYNVSLVNPDSPYSFNSVDYTVKSTLISPFTIQTSPANSSSILVTLSWNSSLATCKDFGFGTQNTTYICDNCIPAFSPIPGYQYLLSAWVKEEYTNTSSPDTYSHSGINISFNQSSITLPEMFPSGPIIDGWQRIEESFFVPDNATDIEIELSNDNAGVDVFFDDIRIHPFRSNMKSFVYNPSTRKVVAILDENNYSTRYEYDDEGILIRVKKETERGVMTLNETRTNQSKINK